MERQSTRLIIIGLLLSVINLFVISCGQDAFVTLSVFFLLFMLSSQSWISLLFVRLRPVSYTHLTLPTIYSV